LSAFQVSFQTHTVQWSCWG